MIEFIPFKPEHLEELQLQPVQAYLQTYLDDPDYRNFLKAPGLSWTGMVDGQVVGCAGVLEQWVPRATVWALFGETVPRRAWPAITRFVEKVLNDAHAGGFHRLEAVVDPDHMAGARWAQRLGFICETPWGMKSWGADRRTYLLFARVQEGIDG